MKRLLQISAITAILLFSRATTTESKAQFSASISFQSFYDDLSPYGNWIYYPHYGYVWSPSDRYNFHPYRTHGHWVWTNRYGWLWSSDYEWGWAPFHYGRWFRDAYYGWLWVPDYEWAPAWVVWRSNSDYYGWAPMQPGINISFSFGHSNMPYDYWSFVPNRYIVAPNISNYYIDQRQYTTIINKTTVVNYSHTNNVYMTGPSRADVERTAKTRIQPVEVRPTSRPGKTVYQNNAIDIYRPSVSQKRAPTEAPKKYQTYTKDNRAITPDDKNVPGRNPNNPSIDRNAGDKGQNAEILQRKQQDALKKAQQDQKTTQDALQRKQQDALKNAQQNNLQKQQQQDQQRKQQQDNLQKQQQQDQQRKQQQDNLQKQQQQDQQRKQQQDNLQKQQQQDQQRKQQQDNLQKQQQQDQQRKQQQDNLQKQQQQDQQRKQQQDNLQKQQQQDQQRKQQQDMQRQQQQQQQQNMQKQQQQDQQRQQQQQQQKQQQPPKQQQPESKPPPAPVNNPKQNGHGKHGN